MANQQIIEKVKAFILKIRQEGIPVSKVYLFGSYAKGLESADSDIDVMILTDEASANDDWKVGKIWRLTRQFDSRIEPFVIGQSRFESNDSPIVQSVKQEGLMINV